MNMHINELVDFLKNEDFHQGTKTKLKDIIFTHPEKLYYYVMDLGFNLIKKSNDGDEKKYFAYKWFINSLFISDEIDNVKKDKLDIQNQKVDKKYKRFNYQLEFN